VFQLCSSKSVFQGRIDGAKVAFAGCRFEAIRNQSLVRKAFLLM
jgi:hypothetical protein